MDDVVKHLVDIFGLSVAYNDPHIHVYGLRNAVLPAGTGFLEVVEPVRPDCTAARFLSRRGDAGYMVILQDADAEAHRARLAAMGVRVVEDIDTRDYRASHYHPADFAGVLVSIDQQRSAPDHLAPHGDWTPAGPDWRAARTNQVLDMTAVTLSAPDPEALARRWSELLDQPMDGGGTRRITLAHGAIGFVGGGSRTGTAIEAIELKVADVDRTIARAKIGSLNVNSAGILIGGVRFKPVA
jgi:hypothetical protein